jgi:hypothetical protein
LYLLNASLEQPYLARVEGKIAGLDPAVWVAIVGVIAGGGVVWKIWDVVRSRPRFQLSPSPSIDQARRVRVDIVQRGNTTGYLTYLDIVSVSSTLYRILHRIFAGPEELKGGISVLPEPFVENANVPLTVNQPATYSGPVVESTLLPVPWKPWRSMEDRRPRYSQLRVKVRSSTHPPSYTRLEYRPSG